MPRYADDVLFDVEGRNVGSPDAPADGWFRNLHSINDIKVTGGGSGKLPYWLQPFSATPVFDASNGLLFEMTLTGNVTSSTLAHFLLGQFVCFIIHQDATGGRTFTWPANVKGAADIGTDPSDTTAQLFISTGAGLIALTPGVIQ